MRLIIVSFLLFVVSASINCANESSSQLIEYEVFAQKYEATFGEKPSNQVWHLGKKTCVSACMNIGCHSGDNKGK